MGTHPIFESDFDCLTDMSSIGSRLAGAANPQFGAGYPQNQQYRSPATQNNTSSSSSPAATSYAASPQPKYPIQTGYGTPPPQQHQQQQYNSNPNYMGSSAGGIVNQYPPQQQQQQQQPPYAQYQPPQQSPQYGHSPYGQQAPPPRPTYGQPQYPQQPHYNSPYGQHQGGPPGGQFNPHQQQATSFQRNLQYAKAGMHLSNEFADVGIQKIIEVKDWGLKSFRITKQVMNEKLGKGTRTVDFVLEEKIEKIKDTKSRYTRLLELAKLLQTQVAAVQGTKRAMAEVFTDLSHKQRELEGEMLANGQAFNAVNEHSNTLVKTLETFTDGLKTLVERTIQDSLDTITKYEKTRVEFDAYRTNMEEVQMAPRRDMTGQKLREAQMQMDRARAEYERKRQDVAVKLQLLDENRIKVMRQQLVLLHSATVAYFNGAHDKLAESLKLLERYQEENRDEIDKPSILETTETNGESPQVCYDMLGNATIPHQQQQQAPNVQLHQQQAQFDMLGNPIETVAATPTPPPVEENIINGVNIVGVVNTSDTVNEQQADDKPADSVNLISTEEEDLQAKFKEATI